MMQIIVEVNTLQYRFIHQLTSLEGANVHLVTIIDITSHATYSQKRSIILLDGTRRKYLQAIIGRKIINIWNDIKQSTIHYFLSHP